MKILFGILILSVILVSGISGCPTSSVECVADSDCVPATCCHPTSCVSADKAPLCGDVMCTMDCQPGTMDCGQGYCYCDSGKCNANLT